MKSVHNPIAWVLVGSCLGWGASALASSQLMDGLWRFVAGDPISAEEINANFAALEQRIADSPPGPTGPTGAVGADGARGPAGPQGSQGPTGPQGPMGPAGPAGAQGPPGAPGPTGLAGPVGPTGASGVRRICGVTAASFLGGNFGGYAGAATQCSTVPSCGAGSVMCTFSDVHRHNVDSAPLPPPLGDGIASRCTSTTITTNDWAWATNTSADQDTSGREYIDCGAWQISLSTTGGAGFGCQQGNPTAIHAARGLCNVARPILCCR